MKKSFIAISALVVLSIVVSPASLCAQMTNDTIIAIINNEVITSKDLQEYLKAIYLQISSEGRSDSEIKDTLSFYEENGLEKLIENKLILGEANNKEIIVREKAIDEKLAEIKKQYSSEQEFLKEIVKEGFTVTDLKKKITDQIKIKFLIEAEVKSKVFVNPQDVTDYYNTHRDEFNKPDGLHLESIFIPYQSQTMSEVKKSSAAELEKTAVKKANEALALMKKGEEFSSAAKKFSQLPNLGIVHRGQMLPAIEEAVFHLKEGEISEPLKTDAGIYIFKVKKQLPPEVISFEEVKAQVYNMLTHQKFQKRFADWLEELKKKAYIEIKG